MPPVATTRPGSDDPTVALEPTPSALLGAARRHQVVDRAVRLVDDLRPGSGRRVEPGFPLPAVVDAPSVANRRTCVTFRPMSLGSEWRFGTFLPSAPGRRRSTARPRDEVVSGPEIQEMHVSKRVAVWCAVVSAAAVVLAGCVTGAPPGTGTTGPDDISITFDPSGTDGPCVQVPTAWSNGTVRATHASSATEFIVTVVVDAPLCDPLDVKGAIYAMPQRGIQWPQTLAGVRSTTLSAPGTTTFRFAKGCTPAQFDVLTGSTPPVIRPGGPIHGPLLFPSTAQQYFGNTNCPPPPSSTTTTTTTATTTVPETTTTVVTGTTTTTALPTTTTVPVTSTTTVPGPPTTVPPTYLPQNPIYNNPNYFTGPTNGICTKLEPVATPFVMPVPEFGNVWTLLVIKAGSGTQANQLVAAPAVGQSYTHTSGQDISHVIFCQRPFSED